MSELVDHLPFPFPGETFPDQLGAVVQKTVLDGDEPARLVIHDADNTWLIGDGVSDPNEDGAVQLSPLADVIEGDESLAELATLPIGSKAERDEPGDEWVISPFEYDEDDDDE